MGSSRRFSVTVPPNFSLAGLGEGVFVPSARWRRGGGVPSPRAARPRPNFLEEPAQRHRSCHAGKDRGCQSCPRPSALRNLLHSQPENDRARFQAGVPSPKGFLRPIFNFTKAESPSPACPGGKVTNRSDCGPQGAAAGGCRPCPGTRGQLGTPLCLPTPPIVLYPSPAEGRNGGEGAGGAGLGAIYQLSKGPSWACRAQGHFSSQLQIGKKKCSQLSLIIDSRAHFTSSLKSAFFMKWPKRVLCA